MPVANAALTSITVSNTDPNKVWVTFSGYSAADKVYKSTDGGATWTNVSAGLPNLPVNAIVYTNGSANDAIYIGADIGVYYLDNTLSSVTPFMTALPNCAVRDLEIFYPTGKLRAATFGRGVWESDLYVPTPLPNLTINDVTKVEGNSGTSTFTFTVSLSAPAPAGGVTFSVATADGSATAGSDYVALNTTGTIAAGSSSTTVAVTVNGDVTVEGNETFNVKITNATNAVITDGTGIGTITNDDAPLPNLTIKMLHRLKGTAEHPPLLSLSAFQHRHRQVG